MLYIFLPYRRSKRLSIAREKISEVEKKVRKGLLKTLILYLIDNLFKKRLTRSTQKEEKTRMIQ